MTRHQDFVYFLRSPATGLIKIGHSADLQQRIRDLSMQQGVELELLFCVDGDRSDEARLHRRFASSRRLGEWFVADELAGFVDQLRAMAPWEARAVIAGAYRKDLIDNPPARSQRPSALRRSATVVHHDPVPPPDPEDAEWQREAFALMFKACADVVKRIGIGACAAELDAERPPAWPPITTQTLARIFVQRKHALRSHWMPWFAARSGALRDLLRVVAIKDRGVAREYLELATALRAEVGDDEAERLLAKAAA